MHKLLMTSALVVPLLGVPVLAQETPPADPATDADQQQLQVEGDDTLDEGAVADDPAADDPTADDPAMADDPAATDPAATDPTADDPAMADDPAATDPTADDPAMADDPAADDPMADDPGMADDPAATDDDAVAEDEAPVAPPDAVVTTQAASELRGDWVIGTSVTSPDDETIGAIQDLIIDQEEGRITAAVLSVGGFLGFGAKNIAVNWDELQIDYDGREIVLDISREEAEAAPDYEFRERAELPPPPDAGMAPAGEAPAAPTAPQ